ncbi:MAG: M23 family metallopeptidase [Clostridia bacterium]|nr:M23 family metallopeptidase [Clostridia bacterium]
MKEQNEQEKEKIKAKKPRKKLSGEKRFYLITALGCAAALIAIVAVAIAVSGNDPVDGNQASGGGASIESPLPSDSSDTGASGDNGDGGEQVGGSTDGMVMPLETVTVLNDYGFYHNITLNSYYEHKGVDFTCEAGTNVRAVDAGTIESIYKDDILLGTEITIDHGDGLKSVYRFVSEAEGLTVGQTVNKGDVIATVAEANGNEYKDGAHLHFEITKDSTHVDPAVYLTLEEK